MVVLEAPSIARSQGVTRVTARVRSDDGVREVWFATPHPVEPHVEAFVPVALLAAMRANRPLAVRAPVSPRLLANLVHVQGIFASWFAHLHPVAVLAEPAAEPPEERRARARACFFSGGVDSFYTALTHQSELTGLLLVRGFDIALDAEDKWAPAHAHALSAAAGMEIPLLVFETNMRALAESAGDWGEVSHGTGLAGVALLLQSSFGLVYVPASHKYSDSFAWGSHPLLDPLWSTERTGIRHDGAEVSRVRKIERIVGHDVALEHLRVCWAKEGTYNCSRCEKCLRTMCTLELFGALGRCRAFESCLDSARLARVSIPDESVASFVRENLELARRSGAHPELARALHHALWRYDARRHVARVGRLVREVDLPLLGRDLTRRVTRAFRGDSVSTVAR